MAPNDNAEQYSERIYRAWVSDEPLDVIRANECEAPDSLVTRRFRALWNEIQRLRHSREEAASAALAQAAEALKSIPRQKDAFDLDRYWLDAAEVEKCILALAPDPNWLERHDEAIYVRLLDWLSAKMREHKLPRNRPYADAYQKVGEYVASLKRSARLRN